MPKAQDIDDILNMIDSGEPLSSESAAQPAQPTQAKPQPAAGPRPASPQPTAAKPVAPKSSQQSLRDRMREQSESYQKQKAHDQEMTEREEQLTSEVVDEELEEEHKPAVNPKIIIGAIILVVLIIGVLVVQAVSKKSKEPEVEETAEQVPMDDWIIVEEPVEEEPPAPTSVYTAEQVQNLLAAGASQQNIEEWQANNVNYTYVYYTMLEKYYGFQLENKLPLYETASDEYKAMLEDTWLSLPERTDVQEWTKDAYLAYTYEVKQNLDYEKVTPYGNQLFLKVYLDADVHASWFFLNISPEEWNQLDDQGNVVVDYTYCTHYQPYEQLFDAVEDTENIFITSATLDIIESLKNQNKRAEENQ